ALASRLFVKGNKTIGKSEVTGIGTASVIHHVAIQAVLARTATPSHERSAGLKKSKMSANNKGPKKRPTNFALLGLSSSSCPSSRSFSSFMCCFTIFESAGLTKRRNFSFVSSCIDQRRFHNAVITLSSPFPYIVLVF